ncbi:MAG: T9SS type A sorting domain-containing protein [Ignavibacteriales bacterium]|nr:T9SS type A sorting domain-containing protein [Ignavibacteriales bacterium]
MRKLRNTFLIISTLLFTSVQFAQTDIFVRSAVIPNDTLDVGGWGGAISGVDFDGDGLKEIYAVNNDWSDLAGLDWIPRIYKYENSSSGWEVVWSTRLPLEAQNTWPAFTYGDWDSDGNMEIIWGPVNNSGAGDSIYPRIIVFESKGDGSDVMGIDNGDGTYKPNAMWTINDEPNYNLRPFRWHLYDIDSDGQQELIFAGRAGNEKFGVVSVDNIPDDGDGSETFTLEESALDTNLTVGGSIFYDIAVLDSVILLIQDGGNVVPVVYSNGKYTSLPAVAAGVPTGSWKSSVTVDIDKDGTNEVIVNGYGSSAPKTFLLQFANGVLTTTEIANLTPYVGAGGRLYGGDAGDLDSDGNLDYVFGTRGGSPNAAIYRLEYQGGSITDPASYYVSRIDELLFQSGGRYDVVSLGNLDDDSDLEIVYSGIPATDVVPLVVLDRMDVDNLYAIGEAKGDESGDDIPDMLGQTVTVSGVVLNKSLDANSMQIFIQDPTGGIQLFSSGNPAPADLKVGDRVLATGKVAQYRGLNEIEVTSPALDVVKVDSGRIVIPKVVTIDQYLANAEALEGTLIKIEGVAKTGDSPAWPAAGSNANLTLWTGHGTTIIGRVDKDTDVDEGAEPVWPISAVGVSTQFTSAAAVYNDGYQITFLNYADITANVQVGPLPYFALLTPANNSTISITDSAETFNVGWEAATDLNNDVIGYQFVVLPEVFSAQSVEPHLTVSATDILGLMAGADSITFSWTVLVLDANSKSASSMDTFTVTFVNDILVGVENVIPSKFFVDQNYPNPFNPTTTIKFGLPEQAVVDLKIYDILGREVATIINNKTLKAGSFEYSFDASKLASGTYIYRLTSNNNVVTKKMLLLK